MGLLGVFFCARPAVNRQSGDRRRGVRGLPRSSASPTSPFRSRTAEREKKCRTRTASCFGGGTRGVGGRAHRATKLRAQGRAQKELGNEGKTEGGSNKRLCIPPVASSTLIDSATFYLLPPALPQQQCFSSACWNWCSPAFARPSCSSLSVIYRP